MASPPRPTFGPSLPPEMESARSLNPPIELTPLTSGPCSSEDDGSFAGYPNDGKWRPSRGLHKVARIHIPYTEGGSPYRMYSRVIDGHYQTAIEVDPLYLLDTGMTYDEAVKKTAAGFSRVTGANPNGTVEEQMQTSMEYVMGRSSNDENPKDLDPDHEVSTLAAMIKRSGSKKKQLCENMAKTLRGENGEVDLEFGAIYEAALKLATAEAAEKTKPRAKKNGKTRRQS